MITDEQYGALKRIIEEIKEKRAAKCLFINCVVNQHIMGNDIELVESFLKSLEECNLLNLAHPAYRRSALTPFAYKPDPSAKLKVTQF